MKRLLVYFSIVFTLCMGLTGLCFAERIVNGQVQETEITFTVQEAQAAIGLFDLATKSGGLQVAEPAVVLTKKLQEAFKMKPKVVKEEPNKDEKK